MITSAIYSGGLVNLTHVKNSRDKGHPTFRSNIGIGDSFMCEREHRNA